MIEYLVVSVSIIFTPGSIILCFYRKTWSISNTYNIYQVLLVEFIHLLGKIMLEFRVRLRYSRIRYVKIFFLFFDSSMYSTRYAYICMVSDCSKTPKSIERVSVHSRLCFFLLYTHTYYVPLFFFQNRTNI
jgi:hypothetical protein